jgi:aminomethyltransferase
MSELLRTPIFPWHVEHGARMVEFAGWEMPVQYQSILEEHHATRRHVGLFDISHMGRLRFTGPDAGRFLDHVLTRRVLDMRPGAVRYSLITRDDGGILDDVLVYRLSEPADHYFLVVNAANRGRILSWLEAQRRAGERVSWTDETESSAMVAVQGPASVATVNELLEDQRLEELRYYQVSPARVAGCNALLSRTGYTGEDGCELIVEADEGLALWEKLVQHATRYQGRAAGLGARDTLRLEAGMPLYGHELTEQIDPIEAGLQFAVQCDGRQFPGAAVLRDKMRDGPRRKRVGLTFDGRRVPRQGYRVLAGGTVVGYVTSGTFSPTLERPIAMAYVEQQHAAEGTTLDVDIRGHLEPARVVPLPFYRRPPG